MITRSNIKLVPPISLHMLYPESRRWRNCNFSLCLYWTSFSLTSFTKHSSKTPQYVALSHQIQQQPEGSHFPVRQDLVSLWDTIHFNLIGRIPHFPSTWPYGSGQDTPLPTKKLWLAADTGWRPPFCILMLHLLADKVRDEETYQFTPTSTNTITSVAGFVPWFHNRPATIPRFYGYLGCGWLFFQGCPFRCSPTPSLSLQGCSVVFRHGVQTPRLPV